MYRPSLHQRKCFPEHLNSSMIVFPRHPPNPALHGESEDRRASGSCALLYRQVPMLILLSSRHPYLLCLPHQFWHIPDSLNTLTPLAKSEDPCISDGADILPSPLLFKSLFIRSKVCFFLKWRFSNSVLQRRVITQMYSHSKPPCLAELPDTGGRERVWESSLSKLTA